MRRAIAMLLVALAAAVSVSAQQRRSPDTMRMGPLALYFSDGRETTTVTASGVTTPRVETDTLIVHGVNITAHAAAVQLRIVDLERAVERDRARTYWLNALLAVCLLVVVLFLRRGGR